MHGSRGKIQEKPRMAGFGLEYSDAVPTWTNGTANIEPGDA
jgi:hypothetical protein